MVNRSSLGARVSLGSIVALYAACGGGGSSPTTPTPPPSSTVPTFTIANNAVTPKELQISPGQRVRFVNNDSRAHTMTSDPHPEHTDCPEINQVGFTQPGQTKETGNFVTARTCGFHDHDLPGIEGLRGRIVIR